MSHQGLAILTGIIAKFEIIQNLIILDLSKEIEFRKSIFDTDDILSIEDYVKYIVLNYQSKYPDKLHEDL